MKISSIYDVGTCWHGFNQGRGKKHHRKKGNVSYQYATLYSRTTPIAKYHKNAKGDLYILVQSRRYSVSTEGQISKCLGRGLSVTSEVVSFRVPCIGAQGGWSPEKWLEPDNMHATNVIYLRGLVYEFETRAIKAWKSTRYWLSDARWRQTLHRHYTTLMHYCEVTGTAPNVESMYDIEKRIEQGRLRASEAYQHPTAVRKRERAAVRRLARKVLGI